MISFLSINRNNNQVKGNLTEFPLT